MLAQQPVPLAMATSSFGVCSDRGWAKPSRQGWGRTDFRRRAEETRGLVFPVPRAQTPFLSALCALEKNPKGGKSSSAAPRGAGFNAF